MDKALLIHMLSEWKQNLDGIVDSLDAYPILKDGRKKVDLENESFDVWKVKESIGNLIERLEKTQ